MNKKPDNILKLLSNKDYKNLDLKNFSEEEIAIQYQNSLIENNRQMGKFLFTQMFSLWKSRIKAINYRIWSYCRRLEINECVGDSESLGILFEPSYIGLLNAMKNFNSKKRFKPYAWKTIFGKCSNYCVRECYIGRDIISRLPLKINSNLFQNYLNSKMITTEIREILNYCYKSNKGNYYRLIKNNTSILKALSLISFLKIYEEDMENISDDKKINFMQIKESPVSECIEKILLIINDLDILYKMIIFFLSIKEMSQKNICRMLNISEPNLTRKINDIEEKITIGLLKYYPEMVTEKIPKHIFENKILNKKIKGNFKLNDKEKKLLINFFSLKKDYYLLNNNDLDISIINKINLILIKTGYKLQIKLKDLKQIHYFKNRLQEEFGNSKINNGII